MANAGLMYSKDQFDLGRFKRMKELAVEISARGTDEPIKRIQGLFDKETGYQTPKIDVRGAVFQDGKILMVRENLDKGKMDASRRLGRAVGYAKG